MSTANATTVTVKFDPNAINLQSDIIFGATTSTAGVMTAEQVQLLDSLAGLIDASAGPLIFTNLTRPAANDAMFTDALAAGRVGVIWNSTNHQVEYTDGTNWYDAAGNLT